MKNEKTYLIYASLENNLVKKFKKNYSYKEYRTPNIFKKICFFNKDKIDIYFHSGLLTNKNLKLMKSSVLIIVNSHIIKDEIIKASNTSISKNSIVVLYPGHDIGTFDKIEYKNNFCERHRIDKTKNLIYFTGKNYAKTGLAMFLEFVSNINHDNFVAIISGTSEQFKLANNIIGEFKNNDKIIFVNEDAFRAADIFILPTQYKIFASNVVRALACKCIVFAPVSNHSSEILDNFSVMESFEDSNIIHKINMLLRNKEDMNKIQSDGYQKVHKLSNKKQYKKIVKILSEDL